MLRVRVLAFALACLASICTTAAAFLLNVGLPRGADVLADWLMTYWSGRQIEAALQYAVPGSLLLITLSLSLVFTSLLKVKKQ